jgi:hypothetical protein
MRMRVALAFACLTMVIIGSRPVSTCGDKFLQVGRGARFGRAYAAIHPASILIVRPLNSVKSAAVRDPHLATALKMAGHRVDVVQQPANLPEILGRSRHDIALAERADALVLRDLGDAGGQSKPSIVGVLEDASSADLAAARQQLEYVLNTPQRLKQILNLVDDVMKRRLENARRTTSGT